LTDAVEKVGTTASERNNRILGDEFLIRSRAFSGCLESMLPEDAPQIVFQQYRPNADMP
jgi:hypothetical protein